ncbi:MAG: putative bile acid beta-glucosidase [Verrucomicrobia bacterium]|nr:putative bile acid beta-glucosidase [Verrucomicrobiota bacterium]
MNRPAKGFVPWAQGVWPGFVLYTRAARGPAIVNALEGPYPAAACEGAQGATAPNHGMPRFRDCRFAVAYPLGQVELRDPAVPLRVTLQAFNPLIPGDADDSGLPVAVFRVRLHNATARVVRASVCANLPNFIGMDGYDVRRNEWNGRMEPVGAKGNRNVFRATEALQGLRMFSDGVARTSEAWGTMALATTARAGVTHRTSWAQRSWGNSLLEFWDDLSADGALEPQGGAADQPVGSLCAACSIPPGGTRDLTFILAWHFPNRRAWGESRYKGRRPIVGNHYATRFRDAWSVAAHVAARLGELERKTVSFVRAFVESDLPAVAKEAALASVSTLRTQTCFRLPDGRLYGWEGCHDQQGSCWGNCTHVWNYEHATPLLFGALARSMRELEFGHATQRDGFMPFRINLPLSATPYGTAAADGQMGCLVKLYRDWQLSGDAAFLRRLWPHARKALEFCWIPGGWDADQDGVMEGCQHNTMDVEYFGPNPQMASWYLGALRAAEEMARAVGDEEFAGRCRALFQRGQRWVDRHLFNGDYYVQQIRAPGASAYLDVRLVSGMGTKDLVHPTLQIGRGCLVDQLAGQPNAYLAGLGPLLDRRHMRTALGAVVKFNRRTAAGHFNQLRSFVGGNERGLIMCSYPRGRRPAEPFPYSNETMTGFEYCVAVNLVLEGKRQAALQVVRAVRSRYDGRRRNPFDEAECGHHYARAMAAWGLVPALTGFHYSGVTQAMTFARPRKAVRWFWSNGEAWGTVRIRPVGTRGASVTLRCLHGSVRMRTLAIRGVGAQEWRAVRTLRAGENWTGSIPSGRT